MGAKRADAATIRNMLTKKQSGSWYIGATFTLTLGILMVLFSLTFLGLTQFVLKFSGLAYEMFTYVLWIPALYFLGRYAGNYVSKTYAIRDARAVVMYVLAYNIFFSLLTWSIVAYQAYGSGMFLTLGTGLGLLSTMANIYIINLAARKFIRASQ